MNQFTTNPTARVNERTKRPYGGDPQERFWPKVDKQDGGCWLWTASKSPGGYGKFGIKGHLLNAHRYSYELAHGPVPDGHELHHLCGIPHCVNPAHLTPVLPEDHKPIYHPAAPPPPKRNLWEERTHCRKGHPYTPENTVYYNYVKHGTTHTARTCRECQRISNQRFNERRAPRRKGGAR